MVGRLHATGERAAVSRSRLVHEAWEGGGYVRRQVIEVGPMGDRIPNSPRLDHWRFERCVRAWPDPAPLPEFFSQARQVRIEGAGSSLAALPRVPLPVAGSTAEAAMPAGLYLIRFRHVSAVPTSGYPNDTALFLRMAEAFARGSPT